MVIIILLCLHLGSAIRENSTFELDFTAQEEAEREAAKQVFEKEIADILDDMIAGRANLADQANSDPHQIRNMAVDASLKDSKGTDAESLYDEVERLKQDLSDPSRQQDSDDGASIGDQENGSKNDTKDKPYTGPSVVSYNLEGRKASRLSIPAYRCLGGGDVAVAIIVDSGGKVIEAKVIDALSSKDDCLRAYAVKAAKASFFSKSTTTPRQGGSIFYSFTAQ